MDVPDAALTELHRAIGELKLNGVILMSNIRGNPLTAARYRPFFEEADRMKLCIFLHPWLSADSDAYRDYVLGPIVGFPFDTTLAVARMCYDGMFKDFPNIRWVIAHAGGAVPFLAERLDTGFHDFAECKVKIDQPPSAYLKRLYYDGVTFSQHNLGMVRDMFGTDHMVMGSDYPHLLGSIESASVVDRGDALLAAGEAAGLRGHRALDSNECLRVLQVLRVLGSGFRGGCFLFYSIRSAADGATRAARAAGTMFASTLAANSTASAAAQASGSAALTE